MYLTILKVIDKTFQVKKSAYHLEDITECSKFPRFLFQIFHFESKHFKNMSFSEIHIAPRQRTLSITLKVLKFSLLFRDSVLFRESIKKNQKSKKIRKPPLPYDFKPIFSHRNYIKSILRFILFITNYVQNQV